MEYISYLKQVYPQGAHFEALLPRPSYRNSYDLSCYDLESLGEIGEGSFSTVYMVRDKNGQVYACKLTSLKHINGDPCVPSFVAKQTLQEIRLLKKLNQKKVYGVMPLYGFYPSESVIERYAALYRFIPRAFIPETSVIVELLPLAVPFKTFMEELFRSGKSLTLKQACAVFLDLLSPLEHMHDKAKVIHRDIKIDNLMLIKQPDGSVRAAITDFNISREFIGTSVSNYTLMGTPQYCHPRVVEKAFRNDRVSRTDAEKQDLYALGMCMYSLLNRGVIAPKSYTIPAPCDSPSREFTELLRTVLSPDISRIPDCRTVRNRLYEMMKQPEHRKGAAQSKYRKPVPFRMSPSPRLF